MAHETPRKRVFVSYSWRDHEHVDVFMRHLKSIERKGAEVWWDDHMEAGARVQEEIDARLEACDLLVAVLSTDSVNSDWCLYEVERALAGGAVVVPVLLKPCDYDDFKHLDVLPTLEVGGGKQLVPIATTRAVAADHAWDEVRKRIAERLGVALAGGPQRTAQQVPAAAEWPPGAGTRIGPWTLGDQLGIGAYGAVYAATNAAGDEVAVKVHQPHPVPAEDLRRRKRFARGPVALQRIHAGGDHPNIVTLLAPAREDDGWLYYVMERVPGEALSRRIGALLRRPLVDRLRFFRGIVAAVEHAHGAPPTGSVYHRDLAPANVLVCDAEETPTPVVIDFDLARDDSMDSLTRTLDLTGRSEYIPPEQRTAPEPRGYDDWSRPDMVYRDLWALGFLLHFILCGREDKDARTWSAQRAAALDGEPESVAAAIQAACERLLASSPADRPQTVAQLAALVDALIASVEVPAPPQPSAGRKSPARRPKKPVEAPKPGPAALEEVRGILLDAARPDRADRLVEIVWDAWDSERGILAAAALLAMGADDRLAEARRVVSGAVEIPANALGLTERPWVRVQAGTFWMGREPGTRPQKSDDEAPRHQVTLTEPFDMLATPVTQALYAVVTGETPSRFEGDLRRPVEQVSWEDARRFCEQLGTLLQREVALPTEAQWEYACRAGSETAFCSGNDEAALDAVGWYERNSDLHTWPVAQKDPNAWGLYDMHGNVFEWCADWWRRYYTEEPVTDPTGPTGGELHEVRGGSCAESADRAGSRRRYGGHPSLRNRYIGFRVVLPAPGRRR